jgi:hypothetical protein
MRRDFKVNELGSIRNMGLKTAIRYDPIERLFGLWEGNELLAVCESAKRLSDFAFENGASEVRHDYHLKLSDGEA